MGVVDQLLIVISVLSLAIIKLAPISLFYCV